MQNVRGRHFLYGEWMNFSENSYENVSKTMNFYTFYADNPINCVRLKFYK